MEFGLLFLCISNIIYKCRQMFKLSNKGYSSVVIRHAIPVERATSREKGQPLCMSQYYRLLTSYRQPGKTRDCIYSKIKYEEGETNQRTENIIVACRNHVSLGND
jgi:choline O-acetyltransferase